MTEQGRAAVPSGRADEARRLAGVVLVRIATEPGEEAALDAAAAVAAAEGVGGSQQNHPSDLELDGGLP